MDTDDGNDTPKYYQKAADKIKKEFQKMAEEQQKTAAQEKVEWESGQRSNLRGTSQDRSKFNTEVQKRLLKQQKQNKQINSSDSSDQDDGDDQIAVDKKALNTEVLSKKLTKIKHATKVVQEKVQEQQQLDQQGILNASGHPHKQHHKSQVDQSKDEGKVPKRRGLSPRNAIRIAFNEESPENPGTPPPPPPEDPVKHNHRHHNTTIDDSLPKNNFEGYGPTFYNNNVNPAISIMEIKKHPIPMAQNENEKDNNLLFDNPTGFAQQIPLKREIEVCHLIGGNSSFAGSQGLITIADVKKGVTNIQEGDPQMAKDVLTMVQLHLEKIGRTQEAILGEIKSEIDTLQFENLYLFQANEKLKAQNNHLLERTIDLTKDLERLKRYVRVKQLEWEKISLIKSTPPKPKGRHHSKKSKNPNKEQMNSNSNEIDADEKKSSSRSRRQHKEKSHQEEFYYDDDEEFDLHSRKSHKSSDKNQSSKSTVGAKKKQETMKYEKNETNCFSFLLGGSRKKKRAEDDDE